MNHYHLFRNGHYHGYGTWDDIRKNCLSRWAASAINTLILDGMVDTTSARWELRKAE